MSLLSQIDTGIKILPQIYVFHASPGVGKTTFASQFESPLILDLEDGAKNLDVDRLGSDRIPDYKTLLKVIDELATTNNKYKTIVIDSATVLERMVHQYLMDQDGKAKSIEDVGGGFGKGHSAARSELQMFMMKLRVLAKKYDIVICAHSQVKKFTDPITNSAYDRYVIQTNEKFAEILTSASDNVFFFKHNVSTMLDQKTKKTQAFLGGGRIMMTEWSPAYEAKSRLAIPGQLPLDYKAFAKAKEEAKPKTAVELKEIIRTLLSTQDEKAQEFIIEKVKAAGDDIQALTRIRTKLSEMVGAQA